MPGVGQSAVIGIFFLMAYLIPMAASSFLDMIRAGEAFRIETSMMKQAHEYEKENRENAKEAEKNHGIKVTTIQAGWDKDKERINELSRTIEDQLTSDPLAVDLNIYSELLGSMCKIKNYNDPDAYEACDLLAAEARRSEYSPVVSITRETLKQWEDACFTTELDDFCNPRAIAFRVSAMTELAGYLPDVRKVLAELNAGNDTMREQIQTLMEMPKPEITTE